MPEKITAQVGDKQIIIETGKLAKQADGAVTIQLGETIVIVAAVAATKAKEGQDFFPLTVDYREKAAAAGKFPGGYFKREGRPTEKEILTCRLTDRPIRPLFPKGWYNEVQVQTVVLSADGENDPDILSIIGASASLMVSDIPWAGPLGAVIGAAAGAVMGGLVGKNTAEAINPTAEEVFWRETYFREPYYVQGRAYEYYAPGFRAGWNGRVRHDGRAFEEAEPELQAEYILGKSELDPDWQEIRPAARAAWSWVGGAESI